VAVLLAWALLALSPAPGLADDAGANPDPRAVTLPSFTESPGCDGAYGISGPYAPHGGYLGPEEPVPGPWGDFFGRTMQQVHSRMALVELPGADRPFTLYVHQRVVPALERVIANLEREAAAGRRYTIRANYTGSYNPITIPGTRRFSFHAVGAAIDINSNTNPYRADNVLVTDMPAWFVKAWTDAGWCWGGDWQDVKDPMHFSWRGPLYASGYEVPAPFAPATAAAAFRRSVSFATGLAEAPVGSIHLVADLDRDGAPDAIRLRAWTPYGHLGVEVAIAQHDFETCLLHDATVKAPRAGAGHALADWTGDGRPDLWAFDTSGEMLRVEVYRWKTGFRTRAVILPEVPPEGAVAFLAGDYDRDGRSDLYLVRSGSPGSVEVWAGRRFTRLLAQADLPGVVSADDRVALGDFDVDGVPDVYLLAAGAGATLRVALGGRAFALAGPVQTGVGAHPGSTLQIADYDGDGREDLIFFDQSGRVTVYLGGQRAADADLAGWFSESFARHWQFGEGCVPNPGFETEPGFRGTRLADAPGPGAAFAYPNPEAGVWTLAALDWSWWHRLPGRFVDLEPITEEEGPGYAVLLAGTATNVELRKVTDGRSYREIPVSARADPVDLAVIDSDGVLAFAVVFGGEEPVVVVRSQTGALLAETALAGLSPVALTAIEDVTGDGRRDLVVVGELAAGGAGMQTISLSGGVVAQIRTAGRYAVEGVTALPAADGQPSRVAVLLRHLAGRRGAVVVQDAATGEQASFFRVARVVSGVITAASSSSGSMLVVAVRNARTGRVRVEGRSPGSGEMLWGRFGSLGFDPADADQIEAGSVLITGHRFGDGNVEVAWWDPSTGQRLG
jgi:hypothetical protein